MFHFDNGLFLTRPRLGVDLRRRQPRGFVSHAHADHMARHELALCTPATAALYRHRLGRALRTLEMPFGKPLEMPPARLTALPAGHCLGAAMLLAEQEGERLLYTGDFKLGESLTAAQAEPAKADILIMETTFGDPRYRMPPRGEVIEELLTIVRQAFDDSRTPVVHAYAMGKSQELTATLTAAGVPVQQHPMIYGVSQVYEHCGVSLAGPQAGYSEYAGAPLPGHVVMTLPRSMRGFRLAGMGPVVSIATTGWAMNASTKHRLRVDHALPISDHADFDELLELVRLVEPKRVFCTHGPFDFAGRLRDQGVDAQPLAPESQGRLF